MVLNITDAWHRFWRRYQEIGPSYTAQRLWSHFIPRWVASIESVLIFELDLRPWKNHQNSSGEVRWATPRDFEALVEFGSSPAELQDRLERGAQAGIIEREGRIVAWLWCETNSHNQHDWLCIRLTDGDVWSFDAWVAPELRGQGLGPRIKSFMAAEYAAAGYSRIISWTDSLNRNAQTLNRKIGARPIGRVFALRILRLTLARIGRSSNVGWWSANCRFQISVDRLSSGFAG